MKRKKPIRFPDGKFYAESFEIKIFKNNHYFRSLLDPENRWCVLVQFEIFEQIWGTVKDSLKDLKNKNVLHFICLLIITCNPHARFQKNVCLRSCCWFEIGVNWPHAPTNNNKDFFWKFHIYHYCL